MTPELAIWLGQEAEAGPERTRIEVERVTAKAAADQKLALALQASSLGAERDEARAELRLTKAALEAAQSAPHPMVVAGIAFAVGVGATLAVLYAARKVEAAAQ